MLTQEGRRCSPKIRNRDLKLLLGRLRRLAGRRAPFVDGELLLLGLDLQDEILDALLEVLLRSLCGNELLARLGVVGVLRETESGVIHLADQR